MKIFYVLLLFSCLIGCKNKAVKQAPKGPKVETKAPEIEGDFKSLAVADLNKQIANKPNLTPKEIMRLFYPHQVMAEEGLERIDLTEHKLTNRLIQVGLKHDFLLDDAIKGKQYLMQLQQTKGQWQVVALKHNWKCWEGRGHTDWGTQACQ